MRFKLFFLPLFIFLFIFSPVFSSFTTAETSVQAQIEALTRQMLLLQIEILQIRLAELQNKLRIPTTSLLVDNDEQDTVSPQDTPEQNTIKEVQEFSDQDEQQNNLSIISITPTEGRNGTKVTIEGTGFSQGNNTVITSFRTIEGVSSSGGKIIINIQSPIPDKAMKYLAPVDVYVAVRVDGNRSEFKKFTLNR